MLRSSLRSCAVLGSLALLTAVACEQKTTDTATPPGTTSPGTTTAAPSDPTSTSPATGEHGQGTATGMGGASSVRDETQPVSGTDIEPMGAGGHAGHAGQSGKKP